MKRMADVLCDYPGVHRRFVHAGEIQFLVEEEGKGKPLVVIHGGPGVDHRYFHPHLSRVASFCRVIYYDLRGQGASSLAKCEDDYGLSRDTDDLEALRKALRVKSLHLFGHSFGGLIALNYALNYPKHLVSVTICSTPLGETEEEVNQREERIWENLRKQYPDESEDDLYYRFYFHKPVAPQTRYYNDAVRRNFDRPETRIVVRAYERWDEAVRSISLHPRLNPRCSYLFLYGLHDPLVNIEKVRSIAARSPLSAIEVFEESGHDPFADEPEKFEEVMRDRIS